MKMKTFIARYSARAIKLADALDEMFDGTSVYTAVSMELSCFRNRYPAVADVDAWVERTSKHYHLKDFKDVRAMISQIKNDVKMKETEHEEDNSSDNN